MAHTTNTTTTNTKIHTDAEAMATIVRIAEANPKAVSKDIDALLEIGEVDCETIWTGYLADAIVEELGDAYEESADLLDSAIVDFFADQMEGMFDEDC